MGLRAHFFCPAVLSSKPLGPIVRATGDDAEKTDRDIPVIFIGMGHNRGDKNTVPSTHNPEFTVEAEVHLPFKHQLLVFDLRMPVLGDPPTRLQSEAAGNKIRYTVFGAKKDLDTGAGGSLNFG